MSKNSNLHKAKKEKNDEFYTLLPDIENELKYYEEHFKGKIVYSNCDSPDSNFVKYFNENKERLGIKEFYHTWYNKETGEGEF
jgi:Holliday junction resolvase RusA-like endonuclease